MIKQQFLESELAFNLDMIESLNKRLRTIYDDFNESDLDRVADSIHVNLKSLYDDSRELKDSMPMLMSDDLFLRYCRLIPTKYLQ